MVKDIAVLVNASGVTASLYEPSHIIIYRKTDKGWNILRETPFLLDQTQGIAVMRKGMEELADFMGKCNIFVATAVAGMPYFELEKARINIWEFTGEPLSFLDYIVAKTEESELEQEDVKPVAVPVPVELEHGHYRISIKEIQENHAGISSKQVLQPLLKQGKFYSLEIVCKHLPPWLEGDLMQGGLDGTIAKGEGEVRVLITRKTCHDE